MDDQYNNRYKPYKNRSKGFIGSGNTGSYRGGYGKPRDYKSRHRNGSYGGSGQYNNANGQYHPYHNHNNNNDIEGSSYKERRGSRWGSSPGAPNRRNSRWGSASGASGAEEESESHSETQGDFSRHPHRESHRDSHGEIYRDSYRDKSKDSYRDQHKEPYRDSQRGSFSYDKRRESSFSTKPKLSKTAVDESSNIHSVWVHVLRIKDEKLASKFDDRQKELDKIDKQILDLNRARVTLDLSVSDLKRHAEREALNVKITEEKLEEFTFL